MQSNFANNPHHAVVDTGCSANTLRTDAPVCNNNKNAPTQYVGTPTGHTIKSSESAMLQFNNIPEEARVAHLYPDLKYKSLLSVGQLCDSGFTAVFRKNKVEITKDENIVVKGPVQITGKRDETTDLLWVTDISGNNNSITTSTQTQNVTNSVYAMKTIPDVINYHHQSVWSPTERTWTQAIDRGHFV